MKILLLAPQPFFTVRGTPINVRNIAAALGDAGHEVDLLCYPFGEAVDIPGVRIIRTGRPFWIRSVKVGPSMHKVPLDALMMFKALRLCMGNGYDVIHAVEESAFFAAWLARIFRARFIYDMDSLISDQLACAWGRVLSPLVRLVSFMEKRLLRKADFVLTVCAALSAEVRRRAPHTRVVQIEDAPLQEVFAEDREGADALRAAYALGGSKCVVYTGNFEKYQGIDLLLRSAALVAGRETGTRFILVGGHADQIERLRLQAQELGIAGQCVFTGPRPPAEMPAFMTLASVLVSPRTHGVNTALKIYTYMQSGRPIVATDLATHTQVLDEMCALLAKPCPEDMAACIIRALKDPELAQRLGNEARKRVEENFSLEVFNRKVKEAYESLASEP